MLVSLLRGLPDDPSAHSGGTPAASGTREDVCVIRERHTTDLRTLIAPRVDGDAVLATGLR